MAMTANLQQTIQMAINYQRHVKMTNDHQCKTEILGILQYAINL